MVRRKQTYGQDSIDGDLVGEPKVDNHCGLFTDQSSTCKLSFKSKYLVCKLAAAIRLDFIKKDDRIMTISWTTCLVHHVRQWRGLGQLKREFTRVRKISYPLLLFF